MAKKQTVKKPAKVTVPAAKSRRLKMPQYKSFKISKRIKHPAPPLSSAVRIFARAMKHLWLNKRIFAMILALYVVLMLIFVRGFAINGNFVQIRGLLQGLFNNGQQLTTGFTLLGYLLSNTAATSSDVASTYQSILLVVFSLALIWSLRQTHAAKKIKLREAFYRSQYALVPFLLVLIVVIVQLIPLLVANALYGYVFNNGLAVSVGEKIIWGSGLGLLALLSLFWISVSIMAVYVVTLPGMTPLKALHAAKQLVRYRRWMVVRKILALPIILVVCVAVIVLPLIIFAASVASWTFFVLSLMSLVVVHSYLYSLYRELL